MTSDELMAAIQQNYPEIFALINKPGIFDVMNQALADPNHPWNSAQITEAIHQTPYWTSTTDVQRQWDILGAVDPATAKARGDAMTTKVLQMAQGLGITLDPTQQWDTVTAALRNGWSDTEISHNLLFNTAFGGYQQTGSGAIQGSADSVKSLASNYGVPISDQAANQWALGVQTGTVTQDGLKAYMIEQAKSLYPGLSAALDSGITVRQYADPYAQVAAQKLGINPNDFNLSDPKWSAPLQQIDPKTGQRTAMTLDAWTSKIMTDSAYGYDTTSQAKDQASQFASQLAKQFGAM